MLSHMIIYHSTTYDIVTYIPQTSYGLLLIIPHKHVHSTSYGTIVTLLIVPCSFHIQCSYSNITKKGAPTKKICEYI